MKTNFIFSVAVLILIIVICYLFIGKRSIEPPFKCLFYTHYELNKNEVLDVSQDLRLYSESSGYFLINGVATVNGVKYNVRKTLVLKDGEFIDKKTIKYRITNVEVFGNVDSYSKVVESYLNDFKTTSTIFQIDIFPIKANTFLIGGPNSFISTCKRY